MFSTEFCLTSPSERPSRPSAGTANTVRALLGWFDERERDVPWRGEKDPYRVWVAEVMAQQTRVDTVASYYARFVDRFPTPATLADARLDDVLKVWEGLGYYARARHLHSAAREVVERHAGQLPRDVDALRALSGIGPYTAGAVASIAFGIPEPAVDGNARRVLSRLFDIDTPTPARLDRVARILLDAAPDRPAALNQAIMDLGGAVCTPRTPDCGSCPLRRECRALAAGTVAKRPPRKNRSPTPRRHAASAIVWRRGRILLVRRPDRGLLGGLWDFPGTEPRDAVVGPATLVEHLARTFGVEVLLTNSGVTVPHTFSHFRLELTVRPARWISGDPARATGAAGSVRAVWTTPEALSSFAVPTYLRSVVPDLDEASWPADEVS
ncbi:MAG: A/G-specific adenine glycosylase [Gemmatimonadota bacterium]